MNFLRRLSRVILFLALAATTCLAQTTTVNPTATITVNAGQRNISFSGGVTFTALTLNGTNQTAVCSATPTFTLTDATGSGAGWNVTVRSANFISGVNTIAATNFRYTATGSSGTLTTVAGNTAPTEQVVSNLDLNTARKILSAATNAGMGTYTYKPANSQFSLLVPASTFSGVYSATMTVTIISGP